MHLAALLEKWLETSLPASLPKEVKALSFNLFEVAPTEEGKFGIELIGADHFDPNNQDWACHEVWEPKTRSLLIPLHFRGETWQECRAKVRRALQEILTTESRVSAALKAIADIGLGFVDGDLELLGSEP